MTNFNISSYNSFEKHLQQLENAAEEIAKSPNNRYLHIPSKKKESFVTEDPNQKASPEEISNYVNKVLDNVVDSDRLIHETKDITEDTGRPLNQIKPTQLLRFHKALEKIDKFQAIINKNDSAFKYLENTIKDSQDLIPKNAKLKIIIQILQLDERRIEPLHPNPDKSKVILKETRFDIDQLNTLSLEKLNQLKKLLVMRRAKKFASTEYYELTRKINLLKAGQDVAFVSEKHLRFSDEVKTNIEAVPTIPTNFHPRSSKKQLFSRSGKEDKQKGDDISVKTHLERKKASDKVPLTDYEKRVRNSITMFEHMVWNEVLPNRHYRNVELKKNDLQMASRLFESILRNISEDFFVKDKEGKITEFKLKNNSQFRNFIDKLNDSFITEMHKNRNLSDIKEANAEPLPPGIEAFDTIFDRVVTNAFRKAFMNRLHPQGTFFQRVFK